MEQRNEQSFEWPVQRRLDGLVKKHLADMAVENLQQRLSAVSEDVQSVCEQTPTQCQQEEEEEEEEEEPRGGARGSNTETNAQKKIIALLLEIREEQQRQWVVLRDLQARLQGHTDFEEEDVEDLDIDLPLKSLKQLDDLERQLEDTGIQRRMVCCETYGDALSTLKVSYLSRMGGATVDDAVRRLMQAVLSFAVGSELNWVGRGQKRSFRDTRLQGVLFRALKRTPMGKEATHHQYADVVKKWLRFAPFRQGGTGRRICRPSVDLTESEDSLNQSSSH